MALSQTVTTEDKLRVLVIDDESSITDTLVNVLRDEGMECLSATSGEEGIELIRELHPQIVFLDMWMPEKDGLETLREIKDMSPSTQVVMISGHATIPNALEALKTGALDFLEKPFSIQAVSHAVSKALQVLEQQEVATIEKENSTSQVSQSFHNPGSYETAWSGNNLGQRTIKKSIVLYGQCLHSGMKSGLVLEPLPLGSGIHFSHLGSEASVPAYVSYVRSTTLATTLQSEKVSASTIEHLLSALAAYNISNLLIKCNGEVPIFDGSALEFCEAIEQVGIEEQGGDWFELAPQETFVYQPEGAKHGEEIRISPHDCLEIEYHLNYPDPVGEQKYTFRLEDPESYKKEIAPSRTFGFMRDVEHMQRMGLAAGGRLNNFILITDDGVVNTDLRFSDELVRHKILDAVGDLFLSGRKLRAKVSASMTGHADNVEALREVVSRALELKK